MTILSATWSTGSDSKRKWLRRVTLIGLITLLIAPYLRLLDPVGRLRWRNNEAKNVAAEFLEALHAGDRIGAKKLVSPRAGGDAAIDAGIKDLIALPIQYELNNVIGDDREVFVEFVARVDESKATGGFQGQSQIGSSRAMTTARARKVADASAFSRIYEGQRGKLQLVRTEAGWRVISYDLLGQKLDAFRYSVPSVPIPPPPQFNLTSISEAQFETSWKTIKGGRVSEAGKLLREIVAKNKWIQFDASISLDELKQTVQLKDGELPLLEALEYVASAAQLRIEVAPYRILVCKNDQAPDYAPFNRNEFGQPLGGAMKPIYLGPLRVKIGAINSYPPLPVGDMEISVSACGLPPSVALLFSDRSFDFREIQVLDRDGRSLINEDRLKLLNQGSRQSIAPPSFASDQILLVKKTVPLRNLFKGLDRIAVVRGVIHLQIPHQVESLELSRLRAGDCWPLGSGTLELTSRTESDYPSAGPGSGSTSLTFSVRGEKKGEMIAYFKGANFPVGQACHVSLDEPITVSGSPSSATVRYVRTTVLSYPFEFRDVPLPSTPSEQIPLRFSSHGGPVEISSAQIREFPQPVRSGPDTRSLIKKKVAEISVRNCTNKPIERISVQVIFREGNGKSVGNLDAVFPANFAMTGEPKALINMGQRYSLPFSNEPVPESASSIQVSIREIGFLDGTTWKP